MKKVLLPSILILALTACQTETDNSPSESMNHPTQTPTETMNIAAETSAIEQLLFSYRDALNTSDVNKVLPLYTNDGVFMPSGAPSAIGQEQIKASYEFVFSQIQLNIEFYIDEIMISGDYAFARTTSKGSTLIHANGETVPEENRELFVLQKMDGNWKISRYMFNKMK